MKFLLLTLTYFTFFSAATHAQSIKSIQTSAGWTHGGMYYQLYSRAEGDSIKEGDIVKFRLTQKINDSVIYATDKTIIPAYAQVAGCTPYDISEMWVRMKRGDSLYAVQLMDTFIMRSPDSLPSQFKKGDSIKIYLKILDVFKDDSSAKADLEKVKEMQLQKEIAFIEVWLAEKNIKATRTASGAFVEIITEGTGNLVDSGTAVSIKYKAMTLAGKIFDTNMDESFFHTDPFDFTTGQGATIKGFEDGIAVLKKGSVARIYIPSMLAYGENPPGEIEPMANMIYEVTIISVGK